MNRILTVVLFFSFFGNAKSQTFEWVKSIPAQQAKISCITAADSNNGFWIGGDFSNTVNLDFNGGTQNFTSQGAEDAFVARYDAAGAFMWVRTFNGANSQHAYNITCDDSSNVYITGTFKGSMDVDPGSAATLVNALGTYDNVFIVKLNPLGDLVWYRTIQSSGQQIVSDIEVDKTGNIIVSGYFSGTVTFNYFPSTSGAVLSTSSGYEGFVMKLRPNGVFNWVLKISSQYAPNPFCYVFAAAIDTAGTIYTCGKGANAAGNFDAIINRIDSSGSNITGVKLSNAQECSFNDMALDSAAHLCLTGYYSGTLDFDPGAAIVTSTASAGKDMFVLKLDTNWTYTWHQAIGGNGPDEGRSIVADQHSNLHVSGNMYYDPAIGTSTIDFDPGSGIFNLSGKKYEDLFFLDLATDGSFINAKVIGGISSDFVFESSLSPANELYTIGLYSDSVDFNPPFNATLFGGNSQQSNFILKQNFSSAPTGIAKHNTADVFAVFPNPGCGIFSVKVAGEEKYRLILTDNQGKIVYEENLIGNQTLNLSNKLESGLYQLVITTPSETKHAKLVITKP